MSFQRSRAQPSLADQNGFDRAWQIKATAVCASA